nr:MAG TPA: hypothetical protein [Caudoviricetes sp.]
MVLLTSKRKCKQMLKTVYSICNTWQYVFVAISQRG